MWKKTTILGTMNKPLGNGFTIVGVCTNRKEKKKLEPWGEGECKENGFTM
jgi:hypothetical protein